MRGVHVLRSPLLSCWHGKPCGNRLASLLRTLRSGGGQDWSVAELPVQVINFTATRTALFVEIDSAIVAV
jgi:hypothetical protein